MENVTIEMIVFVLFGIGVFVAISMVVEDNFRRARAIGRYFIMSRAVAGDGANVAGEVVYRPVNPTTSTSHTITAPPSVSTPGAPDMDAANGGMVAMSRYPSDEALIVYLAVIRRPGGKYRLSANDIVRVTGGDRNHVLALVRQIREGPAQYPQVLTPEQAATRRELGLEK